MPQTTTEQNTNNVRIGLAGTSLGFDLLIIALPLPVLLTLRLRRLQKVALVVIFALGFFVTIIQIIRIFTVRNLQTYTDSRPIIVWSVVEVSLGVCFTLKKKKRKRKKAAPCYVIAEDEGLGANRA